MIVRIPPLPQYLLQLITQIAQYAATIAALALSCATAVIRVGAVNYDDLLATAHKYSNPSKRH